MNPKRQCCHTAHCEHRGLYDKGNIGVHSQKDKRYICHRCGKTFAETINTPLYRKQYEHTLFAQVVSLLAHGCPLGKPSLRHSILMSARYRLGRKNLANIASVCMKQRAVL